MYRQVILGSLATGIALGMIAPVTGASIKPMTAFDAQSHESALSAAQLAALPGPGVDGVSVTGMPQAMPISYATVPTAAVSMDAAMAVQGGQSTPAVIQPLPIVKIQPAARQHDSGTAAAATYTDMTMGPADAQPSRAAAAELAQADAATARADTAVASLD